MWDPYSEFQSAILPNGLTIHAAHWPGRPWEAIGFLIHSGAEHDPVGLEGLAHFIEHAISENTHVSSKNICAFFESCGGFVNLGTTSYSGASYRFFVPADKAILSRAFLIFGQMLLSVEFERCIEQERQVIISEFYRQYVSNVKLELDTRKHKALYPGFWLERSVRPLGNPESVRKITRKDLQSHYDAHYTPANMSIVGVGGMRLPELIELLSKSPFAANKKGARTPLPMPVTDVVPPSETRYNFKVSEQNFNFPINASWYESTAKIPGSINDQVMGILKESMDEVLNDEVREKRALSYAVGCYIYNFRHFYEFLIHCDATSDINGAGEIIENCISLVGNRESLVEKTKRYVLARNSIKDLTGRNVCDNALEDLANYQRVISLAEIGRNIEQVTMNDIQIALQYLRPERRWTLIIEP